MRNIQKRLSVLLILALSLSLALPAAAAFSDLEGHWAEDYMEDLYDRGYLSGYTDGTMKPEGAITACEALVFLSRFYELSDEELDFILSDYGDTAERYVPSSLKWAYEEAAVCLAAGIVTKSELKELDLTKQIEKELLAVFLIRALGLEDEALELDGSELTFTDKADITQDYLGHIEKLVDIGIITGDDTGKFTPHVSVTRAMAATMVSRGLDWAEDEDLELEIPGYSGLTRINGILTSVSSKTVQLRGFDGKLLEYRLSSDPKVEINGSDKSLTYEYAGCLAQLDSIDGEIVALSVTSDEDISYVMGSIAAVATSNTTDDTVSIRDNSTGESTRYKVPDSVSITLEGEESSLSRLSKGLFAIAKLDDGKLKALDAVSGDYEISGKLSSVSYGSITQLKLEDKSGAIHVFLLDLTDMPTVKRGSTEITIDRLAEGDSLTLDVESGEVKSIQCNSSEKGMTGTLSSITTTSAGTYWTIMDSDGDESSYQLDAMAGIYSGSKTLSVSDINIGDTITVSVYGKVITEVELESAAVSSDKLTATVLAVDGKTITALLGSKLVYINGGDATIISAATGKSIRLSALSADTIITVYGSYASSTSFNATSIIVE
ncbi:MAG: S-layer homology domain-containing protein [Candidatus Heteroscillospira sp.]|jgi:hypothetical protein